MLVGVCLVFLVLDDDDFCFADITAVMNWMICLRTLSYRHVHLPWRSEEGPVVRMCRSVDVR